MLESKNGREESAARNNHGTYYDLQITSFALFLGKRDLARDTLRAARLQRIAVQIEPDGRQPLELTRTRAWSYSVGNLDGLMLLANLATTLVWTYGTTKRPMVEAFAAPLTIWRRSLLGSVSGPTSNLGDWPPGLLFPLLRRAANKYKDQAYQTISARVPSPKTSDRDLLLFPNLAEVRQAQR